MRLWVTRTQPGAGATAARLAAMGHEPLVQPVLQTQALPGAAIDLSGTDAIAFTSPNGVAAFAALCERRDRPAFATGEGTAAAARAAGFSSVEAAGGDVASLADLIASRSPGAVAWIRPLEPSGDLAQLLRPRGVAVTPFSVYETVPVTAAPPPNLDGVLIHSPKAGRIVAGLLEREAARNLELFAISPAAAAPLQSFRFKRVSVAPRPDETALLGLFAA